jgi:hypothetical protein
MAMFLAGVLLNVGRRPVRPTASRELANQAGARRRKERAIILCGS